jgi:hypothetical protein
MVGMLQILTYLAALYLVVKGIEVLQIGLASTPPSRGGVVAIGVATLVLCLSGAVLFVVMQDAQATRVGRTTQSLTP